MNPIIWLTGLPCSGKTTIAKALAQKINAEVLDGDEIRDVLKNDDFGPEVGHIRVHPLLKWEEIDVWKYLQQKNVPMISLYFSKNGKRYRSLGCIPCTNPIDSDAKNIDEVVTELKTTKTKERDGRKQDTEEEGGFEKLRKTGYM